MTLPGRSAVLESARADAGFTMVEMVVSISLLSVLVIALGSILVSHFRATGSLEGASVALDEARIAVARVEKEFRSAECVYAPTIVTPGGSATGSLVSFKTRLGAGEYNVQYSVVGGDLVRNAGVGDEIVATGLVAADETFTVSDTARRRLDVKVQIDNAGTERAIETSIAGRNAWRSC